MLAIQPLTIAEIPSRFQEDSGRNLPEHIHRFTQSLNRSGAELYTNYLKQKYVFRASPHQMAVLLQYDTNDTMSLNQLVSCTSIPEDPLMEVLTILVKSRVLVKKMLNRCVLNMGRCCYLKLVQKADRNDAGFKQKSIRISLGVPPKSNVQTESAQVFNGTSDDRKRVIQATILRCALSVPTNLL
ncbi:hypothetical protein NLJ89_g1441 [Agrocybe chaxingu]|uniref:Cullin family profile domain-containing protein n=1 Tax=Agrocybe chaxingu TaxID=84603 RepID=A0A9W8TDF1_9AGAR|nr:hypothetical protein NLJ89_g1441 [Agrocybe chaxingu]